MFSLRHDLKRVLNALAYDNVGNLGELERKLRQDQENPATPAAPAAQTAPAKESVRGLRLVAARPALPLALRHALAG